MTAGRASARLPAALWAGLAGAALLVLAPVAALLSSVLRPETDVWAHLAATRLPGMAVATAVLVAVVSVASAVLGRPAS
ncbi:MAG: iron ABC transporter permease, partial [Microthrixaceae bacterium]